MDKNTIAGFFLIALVLIGFTWWNRPSETELQEMARQDSIAQVEQLKAEKAQALQAQQAEERRQALVADSTSLFFANRGGESTDVVLENDLVKLTLSTQGATVKSAELKQYKNYKGEPVVLLDKALALDMQWATKTDNINAQDYCFSVQEQSDSSATLRLGDEQRHIDVTYTLHPATYMTDITIAAQGMQNYFAPNASAMYVNHASVVVQQEKGKSFENQYSQFTYRELNGDVNELSASGTDEEQPEEAVQWIASKNQFFSAVLIADKGFTQAKLSSATCTEGEALKAYAAEMQTKFDPKGLDATHLQLFTGPNDFHLLKEHDRLAYGNQDIELERLVYFGWPLFRWINRWIIMPLFDLLKGLGLSMGLVILLLTLIIKALVYPATHKSYMSSARMKVLKPEIDKIAAKYPKQEDALKKQQETMQLYSSYGVSPMGGCLPALVQMPIWIALFRFFPNAIALRGESFLWAQDLSSYDDVINWGTNIWLIGDHLSLFCILFTLTNIGNMIISMRQQQNSMMSDEQRQQMKMMQWMMYLMPVIFFFTFNSYSSGLCYYYFLSGAISILIMWCLRKFTDEKKLLEELKAYKAKHANDPKKGMGGLAARLEAMQKMAEEQQRQRGNK